MRLKSILSVVFSVLEPHPGICCPGIVGLLFRKLWSRLSLNFWLLISSLTALLSMPDLADREVGGLKLTEWMLLSALFVNVSRASNSLENSWCTCRRSFSFSARRTNSGLQSLCCSTYAVFTGGLDFEMSNFGLKTCLAASGFLTWYDWPKSSNYPSISP